MFSENQKVLIVTPAYNAEKFLAQTIESVLAQSYSNWQLVIVDDGSTDETLAIARRFESDKRITVVAKKNGGVSSARNEGLKKGGGDFVAFLDADDIWEPNFLELTLSLMTDSPRVDVAIVGTRRIGGAGQELRPNPIVQFLRPVRGPLWQELSQSELLQEMLFGGTIPPCRLLYRSSLRVVEEGFDQGLHGTEDSDFLLRAFLEGARFYETEQVGSRYRQHGNNATGNTEKMLSNLLKFLQKNKAEVMHHFPDFTEEKFHAAESLYYLKMARKEARASRKEPAQAYICEALERLKAIVPVEETVGLALENVAIQTPGAQSVLRHLRSSFGSRLKNAFYTLAR